jgi:tRNA-specific 2-thiouridylase
MKEAVNAHRKRAVLLLSGGLDSTLAARMMLDQGVELFALHFTSPFCTCTRASGSGCRSQAQTVAERMGIPIRTVSKGSEYIEIVRNPRHGRGSGENPCIDCRIFTLRKAREYMEQIGASFLVTGEVVGQRPMSQRSDAFRIIEKRSGCQGLVLRPLSAKHFEPTIAEREGWVDRESLLAISGRSRKEQIRLAQAWGVGDYPCPAGGCLLTEKTFSLKVRDLFDHCADPDMADIHLLKMPVYIANGFSGPSIGVESKNGAVPTDLLSRLFTRYSKPGTSSPFSVREVTPSGERELTIPANADFSEMNRALLG